MPISLCVEEPELTKCRLSVRKQVPVGSTLERRVQDAFERLCPSFWESREATDNDSRESSLQPFSGVIANAILLAWFPSIVNGR